MTEELPNYIKERLVDGDLIVTLEKGDFIRVEYEELEDQVFLTREEAISLLDLLKRILGQ